MICILKYVKYFLNIWLILLLLFDSYNFSLKINNFYNIFSDFISKPVFEIKKIYFTGNKIIKIKYKRGINENISLTKKMNERHSDFSS